MKNHKLTVTGLTIAYKAWGKAKNPPIIALHGWLDNANTFSPLAAYLQDNYYLIAIDLPGHGLSSHLPLGNNYHFMDGLFTVMRIIDELNFEKVHLLGHSMGACLCSLLAGVAPERFLSVNLIEGLGPFSSPDETACLQLAKYAQYLQSENKPINGYDTFAKAALARSIRGYVSLEIAKILCERSLAEENGIFYWRHDRRLLYPSPLKMTEMQVLVCLQEIRVKTCLIWASSGFSFDSELMQGRIKAIKHLTIEHLEGGHHVHMEKPEVVGKLLANFMV